MRRQAIEGLSTRPGNGKRQGFSLVEVLVAVVLVSVSLLGLARLGAQSLHSNQSAFVRSQAVSLAYSILDAMRADRTLALAGGYDLGLTAATPANSGSIANQDLFYWRTLLAKVLPSGTGSVAVQGTQVTITVQWGYGGAGASGSAAVHQITTETQL